VHRKKIEAAMAKTKQPTLFYLGIDTRQCDLKDNPRNHILAAPPLISHEPKPKPGFSAAFYVDFAFALFFAFFCFVLIIIMLVDADACKQKARS
jgi:hypothetical protein